jgi:preprotein translocase subunit SecD
MTRAGGRKFDALAGRLFPQPPPMNRVAIVLDDQVLSAPTVQSPSYPGRVFEITGIFTRAEARAVAKKVNQAGRLR